MSVLFVLLVGLAVAALDLGVWDRVLDRFGHGEIRMLTRRGTYRLNATDFMSVHKPGGKTGGPMICDSILYSSHNSRRANDLRLDEFKAATTLWQREAAAASTEDNDPAAHMACYFVITVDIPWEWSGIKNITLSEDVTEQWAKRSRNHPMLLVDRYKAGMLLMGLIHNEYIVTKKRAEQLAPSKKRAMQENDDDPTPLSGQAQTKNQVRVRTPWVMYLDGDAVWINKMKNIDHVLQRVVQADSHLTLEDLVCGTRVQGGLISCPPSSILQKRRQKLRDSLPILSEFSGKELMTPEQIEEWWEREGDRLYESTALRKTSSRKLREQEEEEDAAVSVSSEGSAPHVPEKVLDAYALILSHGDCLNPGVHVHSGVFVFQVSRIVGWMFDTITKSVEQVIEVPGFIMGDQAVWDAMTQALFDGLEDPFQWRTKTEPLCRNLNRFGLFRLPCEKDVFTFRRTFPPNSTYTMKASYHVADVLKNTADFWFPQVHGMEAGEQATSSVQINLLPSEPKHISLVCPRWFNSPSCAIRYSHTKEGYLNPFNFQCGDPIWHLYGCNKDEWNRPRLVEMMNSPGCVEGLPLAYPEGDKLINRQFRKTPTSKSWNTLAFARP